MCTVGLLNRRQRHRLKSVSYQLGYADRCPKLPRILLSELVGEDVELSMYAPEAKQWNVTTYELAALGALTRYFRPRRIFELGTFDGRTTLNLAMNMLPEGDVITLDLPPGTVSLPGGLQSGERFLRREEDDPLRRRIHPLYGNTFDFDFTPFHGSADLVFVDAGHAYKNVANDSQVAAKLVRSDRFMIVWHDYQTFAGVTRAVDELRKHWPLAYFFGQIEQTTLACLWVDIDSSREDSRK